MTIFFNVLLLVVGFILLIKGADFFVDGSSAVARILKIPSVIVGVTIVSMGTSLPELAVSTSAAISGSNAIAVSNVVGSNIFNVLVVLGVAAILSPVPVKDSLLKCEFPLNLIITVILGVMSADMLFRGTSGIKKGTFLSPANGNATAGVVRRFEGVILLVIFACYIIYTVRAALKARRSTLAAEAAGEVEAHEKPMPGWKAALFIIGGIVAIKFGGDFVVDSARAIAKVFGMSETLIGLTIVACGTSLPELVTSAVAAKKGENDLAVGNVIGSDIFNILFILGISSTITPVAVSAESLVDMIVLFIISVLVTVFCLSKKKVGRSEGIIMVSVYAVYLAYIIIR